MRKARVLMHDLEAGLLTEKNRRSYVFEYHSDYKDSILARIFMLVEKAKYSSKISF